MGVLLNRPQQVRPENIRRPDDEGRASVVRDLAVLDSSRACTKPIRQLLAATEIIRRLCRSGCWPRGDGGHYSAPQAKRRPVHAHQPAGSHQTQIASSENRRCGSIPSAISTQDQATIEQATVAVTLMPAFLHRNRRHPATAIRQRWQPPSNKGLSRSSAILGVMEMPHDVGVKNRRGRFVVH